MTPPAERPTAQQNLVALSEWIDAGNAHRDPEAQLWGRVAKIAEEHGEAVAALVGMTGQNPRKGVTHGRDEVIEELLDVAITALGAVEHLTGHRGDAFARLERKLGEVAQRARAAHG
ncbi:MazG-like family protein [Naasia sp. SYSU D00057]|uniref:MazG-like family protein n=1 Tax=Naasia sp. SYSU D00057 TaxID=2817380 RepID=UPI001B30DD8C|nr:MazG-like family protein [Naasia sp. SYSU D00057]